MTPQERYEDLVDELTGVDGVTPPPGGSGFGRGALRYRRKIFQAERAVLSRPIRTRIAAAARTLASDPAPAGRRAALLAIAGQSQTDA